MMDPSKFLVNWMQLPLLIKTTVEYDLEAWSPQWIKFSQGLNDRDLFNLIKRLSDVSLIYRTYDHLKSPNINLDLLIGGILSSNKERLKKDIGQIYQSLKYLSSISKQEMLQIEDSSSFYSFYTDLKEYLEQSFQKEAQPNTQPAVVANWSLQLVKSLLQTDADRKVSFKDISLMYIERHQAPSTSMETVSMAEMVLNNKQVSQLQPLWSGIATVASKIEQDNIRSSSSVSKMLRIMLAVYEQPWSPEVKEEAGSYLSKLIPIVVACLTSQPTSWTSTNIIRAARTQLS